MSPRSPHTTRPCTREEARVRMAQARAYLEVAELALAEDRPVFGGVAAGTAVLAGIAASDAICCAAIGRRARGQIHLEALTVLSGAIPDGPKAAEWLRKLLEVKDASHYGMELVGVAKARQAVRNARKLIDRAAEELRA